MQQPAKDLIQRIHVLIGRLNKDQPSPNELRNVLLELMQVIIEYAKETDPEERRRSLASGGGAAARSASMRRPRGGTTPCAASCSPYPPRVRLAAQREALRLPRGGLRRRDHRARAPVVGGVRDDGWRRCSGRS